MSKEEIIAAKKKAIFESTLKLVRVNGFHGTPMSMVAKNAGVAAGTIYHYFDSKDALLISLHSYLREQMSKAMADGDDEASDYKTRFFVFWRKHYQYYVQNPDALYFIEQFVNSPYYDRCPERDYDRCQNIVAQFLKTGIENGILKQMSLKLMTIMVHSTVGTAAKIYHTNKIEMGETELQQVAQMIWDGIKNH